ncbi:MAG: chromophore lyase CpcT/CpeT [Synechococcus sp.]|nr:chromophore lyase CpcT/CpeT [Synechococcus sp.]
MASPFQLCQQLCGEFCNQQQAFDNPPIYAHIQVRVRPLSQLEPGSLLLEQAYTIAPDEPYRLRVLQVVEENGELRIHNKAVVDEASHFGATGAPERLQAIKADNLRPLSGCTYIVQEQNGGYSGTIEPGCKCIVERKGQRTYLVSSFELQGDAMRTLDRGHDPESHALVWGSLAGPFEFERRKSFASEIPPHWANHWQ